MLRTFLLNIGVFILLIGSLLLAPPLAYSVYSFFIDIEESSDRDVGTFRLPIYSEYPWARDHFEEINTLDTNYFDYITWRRKDFAGQTINITNGVRKTTPLNISSLEKVWFFGGSTTWGTGVDDSNTFPSIFADISGAHVTNFGESGYMARQSLSLLNNNYLTKTKTVKRNVNRSVIFYDGVNEVLSGCRNETFGLSTSRQHQIRKYIEFGNRENKWGFERTFAQLRDFLTVISLKIFADREIDVDQLFVCDQFPERAKEVATNLVATWQLADQIVSAQGDKFYAFLQPVAFIGEPNVNHLSLSDAYSLELSKQYKLVYAEITTLISTKSFAFQDMSQLFDIEAPLYIDMCHVGPQGNKLIASEIHARVKGKGERERI